MSAAGPMSRALPLRDALQRVALQDLGQHLDAALVRGHEHPELPGDDLVEQAVHRQPVADGIGETDELDAMRMHHAGAAELHPVGEMEDHAPAQQARQRVLGR